MGAHGVAGPTGFEPAISSVTPEDHASESAYSTASSSDILAASCLLSTALELRTTNRKHRGCKSVALAFPLADRAPQLFDLNRPPERPRPKRGTELGCKPGENGKSIDLPSAVVEPL